MTDDNFVPPQYSSSQYPLVATTVDLVEEPLWLFEILKVVCTSLKIEDRCHMQFESHTASRIELSNYI